METRSDFPYHMLDDVQFMEQKMEEHGRSENSKRVKTQVLERIIEKTKRELDSELITARESTFLNQHLDLARNYYRHVTGQDYVEKQTERGKI